MDDDTMHNTFWEMITNEYGMPDDNSYIVADRQVSIIPVNDFITIIVQEEGDVF